jgi:4-hydroxythreonine-4-phosphate dehydrogenase
MNHLAKPIAVTMGDAAGIGPEIVLKLLAMDDLPCRPIIIGDPGVLQAAADQLQLPLRVHEIDELAGAKRQLGVADILQVRPPLAQPPLGTVDARCGQAAFDYVKAAIALARSGEISAIVTAPIHKEALAAAGIRYPGHTEILADLGGASDCAMMLVNDELRVVLVTIHFALRDAILKADYHAQLRTIRLAHEGTRSFGIKNPRIAVAGLNPHAGEGGLFGREEIEIIAPAVAKARAEGLDVSGPCPGDTVFMQARQGKFDVVVAQYHDQGLIPIKYLGLDQGVNITLGLPFVRTSPDHGTAFDIAGKGIANPASLKAALRHAVRLVEAKG